MYGLISKITAVAGQREALARVLIQGTGGMPGCLSYVVAADTADSDALWVTEVWDSQSSHGASLRLPAVQAAITRGRPMIAVAYVAVAWLACPLTSGSERPELRRLGRRQRA